MFVLQFAPPPPSYEHKNGTTKTDFIEPDGPSEILRDDDEVYK